MNLTSLLIVKEYVHVFEDRMQDMLTTLRYVINLLNRWHHSNSWEQL